MQWKQFSAHLVLASEYAYLEIRYDGVLELDFLVALLF